MPACIHTRKYRTLNNVRYKVPYDVSSCVDEFNSQSDFLGQKHNYLGYQPQNHLKIHIYCVEFHCLSSDIIFCAGLYPHSKLQNFKQRALQSAACMHDVALMSLIVYLGYQIQNDLKIHVSCIEFHCLSSDGIFCACLNPHAKLQKFKQRAL